MLERGELSQVTANAELADRLMATARQHLASVRLLADSDPYLAYVAVYDAIRKALSALLQIQGLCATTSGGHLAIMHAVQAQFGASMGAILRPVDRIRVTRHEAEYPGQATYIDQDTVLDDLPKAEAVVEAGRHGGTLHHDRRSHIYHVIRKRQKNCPALRGDRRSRSGAILAMPSSQLE